MKIFLVGMMGSGKTYWKNRICKKYRLRGYDLDFLIEANEEQTISEIFETEGELIFRQKEAAMLRWLEQSKNFVTATGGGTPCFHNNMNWMNQQGITIWIDEPINVLVERLKLEKDHRPLISSLSDEELKGYLENKLNERMSFYNQAAHRLTGSDISDAGFRKILSQYE
ncbi:MAG: shikimate kinase [Chitinophagia bacterium]|jgi:shikimate kinase